MKNRMQENIKANPILGAQNPDILEVREEIKRLQAEAAQNPERWSNDGLRAHFEERRLKLAQLKR